jgi:NitT/TauT family transport system ATP-binding protein
MSDDKKSPEAAGQPLPSDKPGAHAAAAAEQPAKPPDVVVFKNVTKRFGHGPDAKVAIENVSFVVEDLPNVGELIAIVGPSGCGKSTLLRIIAGLKPHFPPTSGEIAILGRPIDKPGADRGMVDQKYSLMPHLTVVDNIAFGLRMRGVGRGERRARACEWVKKVGLEGAEDKYPSELSGGMQQRVSIAATLILEPKILLMDEPFGALDPKIRMQMQELLVQLWNEQQSTVFIVTHSMDEAVYLGDRVFRMGAKPGRLVEILHAPRPDVPPEVMRKKPWFNDITQELLRRLETDAPALGELPGIEKWR